MICSNAVQRVEADGGGTRVAPAVRIRGGDSTRLNSGKLFLESPGTGTGIFANSFQVGLCSVASSVEHIIGWRGHVRSGLQKRQLLIEGLVENGNYLVTYSTRDFPKAYGGTSIRLPRDLYQNLRL